MIYAYDRVYLNSAQKVMGAMFHYAVYDCCVSLSSFYERFLNSTLSDRFSKGDLFVICGKSGTEFYPEYYAVNRNSCWKSRYDKSVLTTSNHDTLLPHIQLPFLLLYRLHGRDRRAD